MAPTPNAFSLAGLALQELGPRQMGQYLWYRLNLAAGRYRSTRPSPGLPEDSPALQVQALWPTAEPLLTSAQRALLLQEANQLLSGQVCLFGGPPVPLDLRLPPNLAHWSAYAAGQARLEVEDVKLLWEPARFGWVFALGCAYQLTGDERYPHAFWLQAETFLEHNPPYRGPNWLSAQEAALRLIAWTYALQLFTCAEATSRARRARLAQAIIDHAQRIPPTLVYARSQNNNHWLSEAAGLLTAGLALPQHPRAGAWQRQGWREFQNGLLAQVAADGSYSQHSLNYHRLMLQLAVRVDHLRKMAGWTWRPECLARLQAAAAWLDDLCDPASGHGPNLGPNDGAYLFPAPGCAWDDLRPALAQAKQAFGRAASRPCPAYPILRSADGSGWAALRAARLGGRPGHADQLHVDIWRGGRGLTLDPGTYRYSAPPPWDNRLRQAQVHNTLTIDGYDQMQAVGRFLYLHQAQARLIADGEGLLCAEHDGYRRLGLTHRRSLAATANGWCITDEVLPRPGAAAIPHRFSVQWLFPDLPWQLHDDGRIVIQVPDGPLAVSCSAPYPCELLAVRGGEKLCGDGPVEAHWGWYSPTYTVKIPALSLRWSVTTRAPIRLTSHITFLESPV